MPGLIRVKRLYVYSDSKLVVRHISLEYQMIRANMISYFAKVNELFGKFEEHHIV